MVLSVLLLTIMITLLTSAPVVTSGHADMDFYFLLFSLFFPRIVLLIYILFFPQLFPANEVPQWADILLSIFVPRILILIYIYQNMGYDNIWFVAHLIVAILAYLGGGRTANRRRRRTVVEEV